MSRFGWAYVSSALTGAVANGPTNSIQFNSGSQILSGTSNFTFTAATSTVNIVNGNLFLTSGTISSSNTLQAGGALTVGGLASLNNGVSVLGNISGSGNLRAAGVASLNAGVNVIGLISGSGNITAGNQITAIGNISSSANIIAGNQLTVGGLASLNNSANIIGNIVITGSIRGTGGFKASYNTYTASYAVLNTDYFMAISGTTAVTASLTSATIYPAGQVLIFKDTGGSAATAGRNIIIVPSGSQTIDGANGGVLISTNSGSITLVSNGSDQFFIVASI
jgi:hypothetical protein